MSGATSKISLGWEFAQGLGLGGLLLCLLLLLLPVRPRAGPPTPLTLRDHERLGWSALAASIAHVVLTLSSDPIAIEHLKPTAPVYEWAGLIALFSLLLLCPPATGMLRRLLWGNHRRFQGVHVAIACLLVPLLAVHVVTTGHWIRRGVPAVLAILVGIICVLAVLRPRREPSGPQESTAPRRLVFGRHSGKIAIVALVAAFATSLLLQARAAIALREPVIARRAPVKVAFPHDKHGAVACVECHHNFVDRTGSGGCYACHRSARHDLQVQAEARFHDFCLGCHRSPPRHFERAGPVTGCSTCHVS